MMNNPYPKNKGFGLRVHRAEKAIKKLAFDPFANIYTRSFDNCFEMGDGDAVVYALMYKAYAEPNQFDQSPLTEGIQRMFSGSLNERGFPSSWEKIANPLFNHKS